MQKCDELVLETRN